MADSDKSTNPEEAEAFVRFRHWAHDNGGFVHPALKFVSVHDGTSVFSTTEIQNDTKVLSCPFSLVITPDISTIGIKSFLETCSDGKLGDLEGKMKDWSERMLICVYITLHHIAKDRGMNSLEVSLRHQPYLDTLPSYEQLTTALTFSSEELELVQGTNLYGATLSRQTDLMAEYDSILKTLVEVDPTLETGFTIERYITASIYLSSRAFPSSLCNPNPSLISTPDAPAHPVLLPILDCLNHARGTPVTWQVDPLDGHSDTTPDLLAISIVCGESIATGSEVLNNYGAKPNSELILGYGFATPDNPDDTILMQLGGSDSKWVIGRKGSAGTSHALESMYEEAVRRTVNQWKEQMAEDDDAEPINELSEAYEEDMMLIRRDTASMLLEATQKRVDLLPTRPHDNPNRDAIREEVWEMTGWYVGGQRSILSGITEFLQLKKAELEGEMRAMGIDYSSDVDDEAD